MALSLHVSAPWHTRAEFYAALQKVKPGMSVSRVQALLGKPDDFWPRGTPSRFSMEAEDEGWCYGADRHFGFPTLGAVVFRDGKVRELRPFVGSKAAIASLLAPKGMAEEKFRKLLRLLYRDPAITNENEDDPQHYIKASNALRKLGKDEALSVLLAYSALPHGRDWFDDWPFWVLRLTFEPSKPGGFFPIPGLGMPMGTVPSDLRTFPTYPMLIVDDIPFCIWGGSLLAGVPESLAMYVRRHRDGWRIRHNALRPPDDPFPTFLKLLKEHRWPGKGMGGTDISASEQIFSLIRTAYRPEGGMRRLTNKAFYERAHREFLATGAHWDEARQMYVRGNGAILEDKVKFYSQHRIVFLSVPRHKIEIWWERIDENELHLTLSVDETGKGEVRDCYATVIEVDSGKELFGGAFPYGPTQVSKEQAFSAPPHAPMPGGTYGVTLSLVEGSRLRVKIEFEGKVYEGPLIQI